MIDQDEDDRHIVKINIGGVQYATSLSTLKMSKSSSLLSRLLDAKLDENSAIFIDRNPQYFSHVLDYMRSVNDDSNDFELPDNEHAIRGIIKEAEFYELKGLKDLALKKLYTCWFPDSFLTYSQKKELMSLCNFPPSINWRLIYRAVDDGYAAEDFHKKCDGHEGTLIIIKTIRSFIFGGYTKAAWSEHGSYKEDKDAFIFSLMNNEGALRLPVTKPQCAIYCHRAYGPTFGEGHDLFIENDCNIYRNSYSNLGGSYRHPMYAYNSNDAKTFLAGSVEFQVQDIEVYTEN